MPVPHPAGAVRRDACVRVCAVYPALTMKVYTCIKSIVTEGILMSFMQKLKISFARFMQGRHGMDALSRALIWAGLVCLILNIFLSATAVGQLFWYIGLAMYIWSLFRVFSRNNEKRWRENAKYTELSGKAGLSFKQWKARLKNSKNYRYFKCPQCKAYLRLPRGVGEVTVTCGKCGNKFRHKG